MTKGILHSVRDSEFLELLTRVLERLLTRPISGQLYPEYFSFNDALIIYYRDIARDITAAVAMEDFRAPLGERRIDIIVSTIIRELRANEGGLISYDDISRLR